jgi:hypothetical protein
MRRRLVLAVLLSLAALGLRVHPASSADQLVLGKVFLVANPDPGEPGRRRVKVVGREASGSSSIVGDPTASGAMLFVVANDATAPPEEGAFFVLPASGWSATTTGFVYRDPTGALGAVRMASIRDNGTVFQVRASLGPHAPFPIPVVPPEPGTDGGATLTVNRGDSYCMRFGGPAGGHVRNAPPPGGAKLFRMTNPTAEAGCVQCRDQGGGVCGGACGPQQFCAPFNGCQCLFIFGTTTVPMSTTTSTSIP